MALSGNCMIPPLGECCQPNFGRRIVRVSVPGLQGPLAKKGLKVFLVASAVPSTRSRQRRSQIYNLRLEPKRAIRLSTHRGNFFSLPPSRSRLSPSVKLSAQ